MTRQAWILVVCGVVIVMIGGKPIGLPRGPGTERVLWRISVRGRPECYRWLRAAMADPFPPGEPGD